jgi:predicted RNA-binding Zn-ribbon protein involved in translation (DUF1610 family)
MEYAEERIPVVQTPSHQKYAFYTRYGWVPRGEWPKEAWDLLCPKCGNDEIVLVHECGVYAKGMIGDTVQCWGCKYEFVITENHWKCRLISSKTNTNPKTGKA